jgi:hypothetical protein
MFAIRIPILKKTALGRCRVLHEAAIHGTPALGPGLGGMNELLEIGNFKLSTVYTLGDYLTFRTKDRCLSRDKVRLYRVFTLERFCKEWYFCVADLAELQEKNV